MLNQVAWDTVGATIVDSPNDPLDALPVLYIHPVLEGIVSWIS